MKTEKIKTEKIKKVCRSLGLTFDRDADYCQLLTDDGTTIWSGKISSTNQKTLDNIKRWANQWERNTLLGLWKRNDETEEPETGTYASEYV